MRGKKTRQKTGLALIIGGQPFGLAAATFEPWLEPLSLLLLARPVFALRCASYR